jgi:hypothetical protein
MDYRRDPSCHSAELCDHANTNDCPRGKSCGRAHTRPERLYHPDRYKTKYCTTFNIRGASKKCHYGNYCSFAHNIEELKLRLIEFLRKDQDFYLFYFKTEWCPYNNEHNKARCVYAHNYQDFRRSPFLFDYQPDMCPNWEGADFVTSLKEGCPSL